MEAVLHKDVAELLGVSVASVSRLRSGNQKPSLDLMFTIRNKLDWSAEDQVDAWYSDRWNVEFENRIREWAASGDTPPAPGEVA